MSKREDDKQPDRHQRRAIDDLRASLKRVEPPITLSDTYEKVRPRIAKSEEFQAVSSEDFRRTAFDKYVRRLREKEEEAERSSHHRRRDPRSIEPDSHPHRRDRDRSRGERSHRGSGRRRSRSPEVDPYEADRRRAIAERERNHRKTTMAENLLSTDRGGRAPSSPPRRERDHREREREPRDRDRDRERERDRDRGDRDRERERDRERDRDYDRPPRPRRDDDSHYDRERRGREEERERLYRRRIDSGSYDGLPYGDDRPSGSRRRRPEDEDDYTRRESRDSKVSLTPPLPFSAEADNSFSFSVLRETDLKSARPRVRLFRDRRRNLPSQLLRTSSPAARKGRSRRMSRGREKISGEPSPLSSWLTSSLFGATLRLLSVRTLS